MDLHGPDGPGWYLYAARHDEQDDGPVGLIEHTRLTAEEIKSITASMTLSRSQALPVQPSQIVDSGVHLIKEAIDQQIEEAEEAAQRAAKLKELRDADYTTDKDVEQA